jgi:hypothetical protein
MAGVATAYSTDALTSSGGVDNEKWEFAVPLATDVGCFHWILPLSWSSGARDCSHTNCAQHWMKQKGRTNEEKGLGTDKYAVFSRAGHPAFFENPNLPRFKLRSCEID